jgi:phosphoglycolate phosphatase
VAVCSDEHHNGSGVPDPFKHRQLLAAGADVAIADFRDGAPLVDYLRGR